MIQKRRKLVIPMHTSYDPNLPATRRRELMICDCVLARMVENGEIESWLPMSAEDVEFLDSRVKEILGLPPEQEPRYLDDYVF